MNAPLTLRSRLAAWAVLSVSGPMLAAQDVDSAASQVWTRADALEQTQLHPRDPYLQFVLMQLSTNPGEIARAGQVNPGAIRNRQLEASRNRQVDLYSIFSGSLALQESLQLDAMTRVSSGDRGQKEVAVTSLRGPTVKSHPWEKLLSGRTPEVSRLAECVPNDHLLIRFGSVSKLMDMQKLFDELYHYGAGQSRGSVRSSDVMGRLQRQWLVETSDILMPIYDAAVSELAITSSDLFFREGTDATLIMRLTQPQLIRGIFDRMLREAAENRADVTLTKSSFEGIPFTHVTSPDRSIDVYVADPADDIHLRSNSRVAFERVMRTVLDRSSGGLDSKSLSQSDEFRYIRTLMPLGAADEDGFVYLSDPFIRNLIGAEKKLTQRNRLVCRSRLQMLLYSQLLFRTQNGRPAGSIDELRDSGCLGTKRNPLELVCPDGGEYAIGPGVHDCRCSHHGTTEWMTPCCEIPVTSVSKKQSDEYKRFVESYSRYWRTFFDPIAVRIKLEPKKTRVETIVLPLINNSIYTGLADVLGGRPEPLDSLPVPTRNVFSIAAKLDKKRLLERMGISEPEPQSDTHKDDEQPSKPEQYLAAEVSRAMRRIVIGVHNFHSTYKQLPPRTDTIGQPSNTGLSWRVHLLPFLEQNELYQKFKLDEPWDSEHNRQLIAEMPDVYATASPELIGEGKTRFVFPQHPDAVYRGQNQNSRFRDVFDGLSNTILAIVADEPNAVIWTRPDDLLIDLEHPRKGWSQGVEDTVIVVMGDGAVVQLPVDMRDDVVGHLLTRNGREPINNSQLTSAPGVPSRVNRRRSFLSLSSALVDDLDLNEFLYNGIGNQIAVHVCDGDPLVDLNIARFGGLFAGNMTRGGLLSFNSATIGLLAIALNSPVYVSIPVEDAQVVDRTLDRLDLYLARMARGTFDPLGGFLSIEQDFYQFAGDTDSSVRAYAFRFGPVTWRFYWARIDNGLYISSKPSLIHDLRVAAKQVSPTHGAHDATEAGHALVRVRPLNWNEAKPQFRIGWAESERRACLDQVALLAHAARAIHSEDVTNEQTFVGSASQLAGEIFHTRIDCPGHGTYSIDEDRKTIRCSIHGTIEAPRQAVEGDPGRITEFAESLRDVQLNLTFLEDGLHAVVTLETK